MNTPIKYLTDAHIESAALELLRKFSKQIGIEVKPPIPVDDIIEKYLGVALEFVDLKARFGDADVLGAVYFDENIIRIDQSLLEQEGRLCFTMAHEAGHWQLHRPLIEMDKLSEGAVAIKDSPPAFLCRSSLKPRAEIQADKFAARILMPGHYVIKAFRAVFTEGPILIEGLHANGRAGSSVDGNWTVVAKKILDEGGFSNVSVEAMRYRLRDLGLVRDAREESGHN